jgi:uncharacterized protein (TIGR02217 family)
MSNLIFPTAQGLKWDLQKTPVFSTLIQKSASGRSLRAAFYQYPIYRYDLSYDILRDDVAHNELKTLMGFYLARQGAFDSFLYVDPSDNIVTGQAIATGDGVTAAFQLIRTYGGFIEPCLDIQAPISPTPVLYIYVNGVLQDVSYYDIKSYAGTISYFNGGMLTFKAGHIPGAVPITANFSYYKRVCFLEYSDDGQVSGSSSNSFNQFMYNLWELSSLSFVTVR